jgi:hypothetical protein
MRTPLRFGHPTHIASPMNAHCSHPMLVCPPASLSVRLSPVRASVSLVVGCAQPAQNHAACQLSEPAGGVAKAVTLSDGDTRKKGVFEAAPPLWVARCRSTCLPCSALALPSNRPTGEKKPPPLCSVLCSCAAVRACWTTEDTQVGFNVSGQRGRRQGGEQARWESRSAPLPLGPVTGRTQAGAARPQRKSTHSVVMRRRRHSAVAQGGMRRRLWLLRVLLCSFSARPSFPRSAPRRP